jgi:putative hydrolases of HD superfamily
MSSLMEFFHAVERLKIEVRRAYKSNGSLETVAEHSWRLCLMTMAMAATVSDIDCDRCLKMALIHDLPEIYAGDTYRLDLALQAGRHDKEKVALDKLLELIPGNTAAEISGLWFEFERGMTREARLVRLIDRLEVLVQHNESDVSQWSDLEKQIQYGLAEKHAVRYGFLLEFAREIDKETGEKLSTAGYHLQKLDQATYERYYGT